MTKKKEKQPRGRPAKRNKEIFKNGDDGEAVNSPPTPTFKEKPAITPKKEVQVSETSIEFGRAKEKDAEGYTCGGCKGKLEGKPKYCPNCGLELNWGAV